MMKRSRAIRLIGVCLAVLQLALPAALAFADASLQRAGVAQAAHVEDHGSNRCHPVHTDDCIICRTLAHLSAPRDRTDAGVPIRLAANDCLPSVVVSATSAGWYGPRPSRAPPEV